jgi:hypothetical protein
MLTISLPSCLHGLRVPGNNGGYVPYPAHGAAGTPSGGCPFNMFRTGIDEAPSPLSTVSNLMDAARYLNVSTPGCWACTLTCHPSPRDVDGVGLALDHCTELTSSADARADRADPDMLELGAPVVGVWAPKPTPSHPDGRQSTCGPHDGTHGDTLPRLSLEQGKAQYAAWCTVSSPLILGFDLGNETEYARWFPVISNQLALRIQSSWAGLAGKMLLAGPPFTTVVPHGATCEDMKDTRSLPSFSVWGKPVSGSTAGAKAWAITAINSVSTAQHVSVNLSTLGLENSVVETDVWTGTTREVTAKWEVDLPAGTHRFVLLHSA